MADHAAARRGGLDPFLDELEAPAPSPCGGSAAAAAAAMAASLVTMVARGSSRWADGADVALRAQALRARLTTLGDDDAVAFEQVLAAMGNRSGTPEQRDLAVGTALLHAAEVPLRIAEAAADVAGVAAVAAAEGSPKMRSDATAAAMLAEAATRAAAQLVEINLAVVPGNRLSAQAELLAAAAAAARSRALEAAASGASS